MSIETVLLIVIVTFAFGFVLDRWTMWLSRSRRQQAVRSSRAA
jgi:type II secretory pathway pseudopilin PulG